jgi:surface protein
MFAVDVCRLPATGGSTFVVAAGLFMLIAGVIVTRWVRTSAGRMSVVVAPLVLLGGFVLAPSVTDPCSPTTTTVALATTVAPTTTVVPVNPNMVLEIDSTVRVPVEIGSVTAADESFVFELGLWGEVDVQVDWGDGSTDNVRAAGPFPHTYTTSGRYTITVSGSLTGFGQDPLNLDLPLSGAHYLKAVRSFGELGITSLSFAFLASVNLIDVPATLPATVTDMSYMFSGASSFNGDVSGWDTGLVTDMSYMFNGASSFNGDVSGWDTGLVTDMSYMFNGASSFNQSLNSWDTGSVTSMRRMFHGASAFNQNLNSWDTGLVTSMKGMFDGASSFNGDVSGWDTGLVTSMSEMFYGASSFNGDVSGWDTGSVLTDKSYMFYRATAFNGDVSGWDTGLVTNMEGMFGLASSFNGDVSGWDTGLVTSMRAMFAGASSFDQSLGAWDISMVGDMEYMLDNSALSVDNYDATLNGWADIQQAKQSNVTLGAVGLYFSIVGQSAHDVLTGCGSGWQIIDEGNQSVAPGSLRADGQLVTIAC